MRNSYEPGNWVALCDVCGFKFKALDLRRRWDNLMVCKDDYEVRHSMDFLRVQKEKITVEFSRPYPSEDVFVGYSCSIRESNGKADVGAADCARVEWTMAYDTLDVDTDWIYRDLSPAIAGEAEAGETTAGIIHSLQPEI